jgi:hypothetical protein
MAGEAENMDPAENVAITWADKVTLTRYIPPGQIFLPVLEALGYGK